MIDSPPGYLTFEEIFEKVLPHVYSGKEQFHSHNLIQMKSYGRSEQYIVHDYNEKNRLLISELLANEDPLEINKSRLTRNEIYLWDKKLRHLTKG